MKARARFALLFALFVTCFATPASAQMSEGERKAAARAAYQEGVQLQDQGKPADALTKFEAAQKLFDAPTHLLHIAECQALLGKLVEAAETYETMIRKPLPAGSPEVFVQAQEQAKAEAPALRARIPTLKVTVKPEPSAVQNLVIGINDKRMPVELVGIARPINPGPYRLTAQASGWSTRAPVDIELREKEAKTVELVMQQGGGGAVVAPVPPPYGSGVTGQGQTTDPNAARPPETPAQPPPPAKPSAGLLFGVHGGVFVPSGKVSGTRDFDTVGSAGGGIGLDFMARFARVFLAGARLEGLFLGGPDASAIGAGQTITSTTNMFGGAVVLGFLSTAERTAFYGDLGLGYRQLNHSRTGALTEDSTFSGTYFALGAGVAIPAGPIRILPKVGLDFGSLEPTRSVTSTGDLAATRSGGYQMFSVGLGLLYNVDFGKKPPPPAAASSRPPPRL